MMLYMVFDRFWCILGKSKKVDFWRFLEIWDFGIWPKGPPLSHREFPLKYNVKTGFSVDPKSDVVEL